MDLVKIGKFLQELRKEQGLTQEQLAEQMGVARRTVSRWETGSNMPDLDILIELSDLYAVDLREIFNGERKSERLSQTQTLIKNFNSPAAKASGFFMLPFCQRAAERRLFIYLKINQ